MTATAPAAPAKVYFTNLRTHARESQLDKLKRLIRHAGIEQIDFENKFVAIKIHFGELFAPQLRPRRRGRREGAGRQALPHRLQYALCR